MAINTNNFPMSVSSTKSERYRQVVIQFLKQFTGQSDGEERIESQQVFDIKTDRYLVLSLGWRGQERLYNILIHLDIIDEKVWIQRNQTESEVEAELMALGIP